MTNIQNELQELHSKLHTLRLYQNSMQEEIARIELRLRQVQLAVEATPPQTKPVEDTSANTTKVVIGPPQEEQKPAHVSSSSRPQKEKFSLENFIGTNLISKIGILITIIGVFIGARYAIDRNLISPSARIILSYCFAALMAFTGFKLKKKYNAFSAVLMGGSIAIVYFCTYIGHIYYGFIPQLPAFAIMFITTIFAIALALWYDQKIIALIGQIAAYAIPILLSDGTGKPAVLFTYISIINAGLMVLSFKKNWKIVYRIAFGLTWSIYAGWLLQPNSRISWDWLLFFITICFITFYVTYLAYKVFKKELYNISEVSVLLANAIIYYFLGYVLIDRQFSNTDALTSFTLANAALHIAAGYGIHRLKLADNSVRLFLFGQGLTFITVAIPVKLDGSWVTLLWSIEAATLIFTATKTQRKLYYKIAVVIMAITVISLFQDWYETYAEGRLTTKPFFNQTFLTSLVCATMFLFASLRARKFEMPFEGDELRMIFKSLAPIIFICLTYLAIYLEIDMYFNQLYIANADRPRMDFPGIAVLHFYTLVFLAVARFIANALVKDELLHYILAVAAFVALTSQLTIGFYALAELRNTPYMLLRYLNIAAIALLWMSLRTPKKYFGVKLDEMLLSIGLHITIITVISSEYVHWMKLAGSTSEYKLGLSIIFGGYALIMLSRGLLKNISYLRISAIVLLGITLIKLFAYDLRALSTIGKTFVLIILGIILLVASFLYNRYVKKNITNES
jgi:uncharacterized membrane protein